MILLFALWLILCFLSFGALGFTFISMKKAATKPWRTQISKAYKPKISILVPTYNESKVIRLKLENLSRTKYPNELAEIVVVDSKSNDGTISIVNDFVKQHPEIKFQVLVESDRKGKSAALNFALEYCNGDVVITSDADCFWPSDILSKALPYLADPTVGGISGQKILFKSGESWTMRTESAYLESMNLMRLGESKIGSTPWFEGGFSAFKKEAIQAFDPYNTGSDDCGTALSVLENGYKALFVSEARFFSGFPTGWREKVGMKVRRTTQLVRVFSRYVLLLIGKRIKSSKRVIAQNAYICLFSPILFMLLVATTGLLLLNYPWFLSIFIVFLVPRVGIHLFEAVQNYLILLISIFSALVRKDAMVWNIAEDRASLTEDMLREYGLI